jgi:hypothetical protein
MLYEKNVSTYKILHSREEELPTSILLGIWVCNAFQGKILFLVILVKCNVHQLFRSSAMCTSYLGQVQCAPEKCIHVPLLVHSFLLK